MADKLALIVGASRGLGAALAVALAPTHRILAVARTTGALEELDDLVRSRGGRATLAPLDITDEEEVRRLCRSIHDRWNGLNLWCHTAVHAAPLSPAGHMDNGEFDRGIAVNVTAVQRLISWILPLLLTRRNAQAVFFDDPRAGERFFGSYGASKAAQIALARAWAAETARTGPKVHILTPRPMPTATRARFFPGENRNALANPRAEARRILADLT